LADLSFGLALSLHLLPGEWNEIHPSVRLEQNGWAIGAYLNSESRISVTAGRTFESGPLWAELGLATGYSYPVVPFIRAGVQKDSVRYFVAPGATTDGDLGLVLGIEMRFE
jgi:hypothetical protein